MNRQAHWSALGQQRWDLLVVGGGITGAGVALEAAHRGLSVLLLEQADYAWGTSSRSSKMVHGGLRYLAMGDVSLTRHSLQEREYLLQALPGLVSRLGYYYVLGPKAPPRFGVKLLLMAYDWLAGYANHHFLNRSALQRALPGFDGSRSHGAYYYTDAITNDSRLVLRILAEARNKGAYCLNYCKVESLLLVDGQVTGVQVRNQLTGECQPVAAAQVVNATGAWADRLRNQVNDERRIRPQRGSHLVVAHERLPVAAALTLMHPDDGRYHFIYPWEGRTVIGTTDLDHSQDLDLEAAITDAEVDYLLTAANAAFPAAALARADVLSTFAGVRPIIGSEKSKDPSKERRDHAVWQDRGLVTVSGGKLTTFRLIARDVLRAVQGVDEQHEPWIAGLPDMTELTPEQARYGAAARQLVDLGPLEPIADTGYSLTELRWCLRHEQVEKLDDLLLRRTPLGLLLPRGAEQLKPQLASLCADELHWDQHRFEQAWADYQQLISRCYGLPKN